MHYNANILLSMFTLSKGIKKNGLREEALPVIRGRASAFGKSLRFRENVIGGDVPADSPYAVTHDLRNISIWEKIRRKRVRRIGIEVSLCGAFSSLSKASDLEANAVQTAAEAGPFQGKLLLEPRFPENCVWRAEKLGHE